MLKTYRTIHPVLTLACMHGGLLVVQDVVASDLCMFSGPSYGSLSKLSHTLSVSSVVHARSTKSRGSIASQKMLTVMFPRHLFAGRGGSWCDDRSMAACGQLQSQTSSCCPGCCSCGPSAPRAVAGGLDTPRAGCASSHPLCHVPPDDDNDERTLSHSYAVVLLRAFKSSHGRLGGLVLVGQ